MALAVRSGVPGTAPILQPGTYGLAAETEQNTVSVPWLGEGTERPWLGVDTVPWIGVAS